MYCELCGYRLLKIIRKTQLIFKRKSLLSKFGVEGKTDVVEMDEDDLAKIVVV